MLKKGDRFQICPLRPGVSIMTENTPTTKTKVTLRHTPRRWLVTGAAGFIGSNLDELKWNEIHHYGLKEHASVDTNYGFVLATELTPSSVSDSIYLPYCVAASCHTKVPIKKV